MYIILYERPILLKTMKKFIMKCAVIWYTIRKGKV